MLIVLFIYLIIGLYVSWYTWNNWIKEIKTNISCDDFEATKILFFIFGIIIWPIYLIAFMQKI